jgi:hypothetical protein
MSSPKKPPVTLRKPPTAAVRSADDFVSGRSGVKTASRSRSIIERESGKLDRKLTIYVPPMLVEQLKIHAARTGKTMSVIVAESLAAKLGPA